MNICILVYFSLYVIIFSRRTNFLALSLLEPSTSKFTILTKNSNDGSKIDENDSSKYDTVNNGSGIRYKFKSESKCVGLNYDNKPIWTYDSNINDENYPLEISLNSYSNSVRVKTKNRLYIYSYRNGNWDLTFESEVTSDPLNKYQLFTHTNNRLPIDSTTEYYSGKYIDSEQQTPILGVSSNEFVRRLFDNNVQILTVDKYFMQKVNDLTHFFMKKFQNFTTYELVNFKIYCEAKYKNETLWVDKRHRGKATYPDLINIYTDNEIICLDFSGRSFLMYNRRRIHRYSEFIKEVYRTPSIKAANVKTKNFYLKLKDDGSSGSGNTTELKIEHNSPGVLKHEFKSGEKCVEISCGLVIWQHDPLRDGDKYPTEIFFDFWNRRSIKIKLANRSYLYSYGNDQWSLKTLSIDESSNHIMDDQSIDEFYGFYIMDNSVEYANLPSAVEKCSETENNGEPSATESSPSPDASESISNDINESIQAQSTDLALATGSINGNSTDLSSEGTTNTTNENGNDVSLIDSSVYP